MASPAKPGDDTYVGLFMVEQPPDWWLPDGYTPAANGSVPIDVTAPDGTSRYAYVDPFYRPPPARVEAITDVVRRELGPVPSQGIGPETRQALVDRGPRPDVVRVLRGRDGARNVLLLGVAEGPYLVALDALGGDVAGGRLMVGDASLAGFLKELGHGVDGHVRDPADRPHRAALAEHREDLCALGEGELVGHDAHGMNFHA